MVLNYLNHCDANEVDLDTQSFVMLVIEKTKLSSSVHSTLVNQFVAITTSRGSLSEHQVRVITKHKLNTILTEVIKVEIINMFSVGD